MVSKAREQHFQNNTEIPFARLYLPDRTHSNILNIDLMDASSVAGSMASSTQGHKDNVWPIFDAFLDLPHPAISTSSEVNARRIIIAPPQGEAFNRSRDVGMELATEQGLARVSAFCFPEFYSEAYGK